MYTNLPYIYEGEIVSIQENETDLDTGKIRYVCLVEIRNGSQILVPNVIEKSVFGGIADYFQRRARTSKDNGNKFAPSAASDNNDARIGDRVYITFICGNIAKPIIIGYAQHPNQTVEFDEDFDNIPDDQIDAMPQAVLSYLGMRFEFPDTGALKITHLGAPEIKYVETTGIAGALGAVAGLAEGLVSGTKPNPAVTPADKAKTTFVEFHDEGGLQVRDSWGQLINVNTENGEILISNNDTPSTDDGTAAATAAVGSLTGATAETITFSRDDESIVIEARSLVSIKSSDARTDETMGDHSHTTQGNETIDVYGDKTDTIQGNLTEDIYSDYKQTIYGAATIAITGDLKEDITGDIAQSVKGDVGVTALGAITIATQVGATLKLDSATVALGAAGTEVLKTLSDTIQALIDTLTQIVALTVTTAFGPSGPPINSAMFTQQQTKLLALKAKLDAITGSI